ncbi:hypothetical protein V5O48_017679 [Marasmius crinis-equi]|uniref:Uncharacterized protein n=1 Tax=Marasmius crinis-equi TaxID=585013 RepID=A0ABR3ENH0_9AGAR
MPSTSFQFSSMEEEEPVAVSSAVAPLHAPMPTEWLRNTATNKNVRFVPPEAPPSRIPSTRPKLLLQSRPLTPVKNPNRARRMKAEVRLMAMGATEAKYMEKMNLFFLDGSRAERWYKGLAEDALFLQEFPSREVAKVTESKRRKELLALRLKIEELGKKDKDSKQWSHNTFADTLLEYTRAAGIAETSTDILSIHSTMPSILKKLALDIKDIKREKETEDRLTALERASSTLITRRTPHSKLATTLANTQISTSSNQQQRYTPQNRTDPFSSPSGGRGNLFQRQAMQQTATPRLMEEQKNILKANIRNYTQRPNTEEGEARWLVELVVFGKKWGKVLFSQDMVYSHRPGTLPPGSGECFGCGKAFHPTGGRPCEVKPTILDYERRFRNWVQREYGAYQRATATAAVNTVDTEEDSNWILAGYEAGKGNGSTA